MRKLKELFSKVGEAISGLVTDGIIPAVKSIQWFEIPVSTYVRWILAIILSVNTVLTYLGLNPIKVSENQIYEIVTVVLNVVVLLVNTYKNNSTSKEALITDQIMKALKVAVTSKEDDSIKKLYAILDELNGDDFIPEHTNDEEKEASSEELLEEPETEEELEEETSVDTNEKEKPDEEPAESEITKES